MSKPYAGIKTPDFWVTRDRNDVEVTIHAGGGTVMFMADRLNEDSREHESVSLSLTPDQARLIARKMLNYAEYAESNP